MTVLDFHVHLGQSIFGYGQTLPNLLHEMDRLAIDLAVVIPVQPLKYHLAPQNDIIARACHSHQDRLVGFCRVDPRQGHLADTELRRCVQELGLKGLFLHPWEETCPINSDWTRKLMQTVQELKIPVMISGGHVRVSMASQIADLASDFPSVPIVVTSGGQINISGIALNGASQLLKEHHNVFLETSGIYREDFIEDLVPLIGSERMLFGSNAPEYCQELELLRPQLAHLQQRDKANLLADSAFKILKMTKN